MDPWSAEKVLYGPLVGREGVIGPLVGREGVILAPGQPRWCYMDPWSAEKVLYGPLGIFVCFGLLFDDVHNLLSASLNEHGRRLLLAAMSSLQAGSRYSAPTFL